MTYWKKKEEEVLNSLNKYKDSKFELSKDNKSVYDLIGTSEGVKTLVEVKNRLRRFPSWWIEVSKLESLFAFGKKNTDEEFNVYLVIVVDDEKYLYDAKYIWEYGQRKTELMNKRTAFNSPGKVKKEVFQFPHESYMIELESGKLGKKYENEE